MDGFPLMVVSPACSARWPGGLRKRPAAGIGSQASAGANPKAMHSVPSLSLPAG